MMIDFSKIDAGELNCTLMRAHDEIVSLRGLLAHAEPKAEAYDTIAQIARLSMPKNERLGASLDITYHIEALLKRAQTKTSVDERGPEVDPTVLQEGQNVR